MVLRYISQKNNDKNNVVEAGLKHLKKIFVETEAEIITAAAIVDFSYSIMDKYDLYGKRFW